MVVWLLVLITADNSLLFGQDDLAQRVIPTMNLTVSEIVDNAALVTFGQQTDTMFGAKVIDCYPIIDIGFDYNIEVKLVKCVEENAYRDSPYVV